MFEELALGRGLRLIQCRLDGDRSCDFQAEAGARPCSGTELCRSGTMIAIRTDQPDLLADGGRVGR